VRVKKLLTVSAGAGYPAPRIGRDGWRRLEQAIGQPIAPKDRRKIRSATREYLANAALESRAAPISAAINRAREIRAALAAFYAVYRKPIPDDERRTADLYIGPSKLRALALASRDIVRDYDRVLRELGTAETEDSGYRVGEEWARWIWRLTRILEKVGLPTGARNDSDQHRTSPFVAFTLELQGCLPAEFRRHTFSEPALAKAVERARAD
jgi:hypothetical protein